MAYPFYIKGIRFISWRLDLAERAANFHFHQQKKEKLNYTLRIPMMWSEFSWKKKENGNASLLFVFTFELCFPIGMQFQCKTSIDISIHVDKMKCQAQKSICKYTASSYANVNKRHWLKHKNCIVRISFFFLVTATTKTPKIITRCRRNSIFLCDNE